MIWRGWREMPWMCPSQINNIPPQLNFYTQIIMLQLFRDRVFGYYYEILESKLRRIGGVSDSLQYVKCKINT